MSLNSNKTVKIIIAVLSVLLTLSLAALIFVTIKYHFSLQTDSDVVDDNFISPETDAEFAFDYPDKEENAYAL